MGAGFDLLPYCIAVLLLPSTLGFWLLVNLMIKKDFQEIDSYYDGAK